jgi:hypothetical protein
MRDVQIILYCDPCLDEGDKTEAEEEREVAVDGVVRLIAVCAEHRKPVALVAGWLALGLDPAQALAEEQQHKVPKRRKDRSPGGTFICDLCDHRTRTRSAQGQHLRAHHGMGLVEYDVMTRQEKRRARAAYAQALADSA